MDTVSDIFDALGGLTAVSNETGIPLTTVHSWKRSGFVPSWRVPALLEIAERRGVALAASSIPVRGGAPSGNTGAPPPFANRISGTDHPAPGTKTANSGKMPVSASPRRSAVTSGSSTHSTSDACVAEAA